MSCAAGRPGKRCCAAPGRGTGLFPERLLGFSLSPLVHLRSVEMVLFHLQLNSCELVGFPSVSPEPLIALPGMGTSCAGPSADEPCSLGHFRL